LKNQNNSVYNNLFFMNICGPLAQLVEQFPFNKIHIKKSYV
jgi:hypothetical protein